MKFSRQEYGVGCHFLFQGVFLTQGLNLYLLHWQVGSLSLAATWETPEWLAKGYAGSKGQSWNFTPERLVCTGYDLLLCCRASEKVKCWPSSQTQHSGNLPQLCSDICVRKKSRPPFRCGSAVYLMASQGLGQWVHSSSELQLLSSIARFTPRLVLLNHMHPFFLLGAWGWLLLDFRKDKLIPTDRVVVAYSLPFVIPMNWEHYSGGASGMTDRGDVAGHLSNGAATSLSHQLFPDALPAKQQALRSQPGGQLQNEASCWGWRLSSEWHSCGGCKRCQFGMYLSWRLAKFYLLF